MWFPCVLTTKHIFQFKNLIIQKEDQIKHIQKQFGIILT